MRAGDALSVGQRNELTRVLAAASAATPLSFRLYVGELEQGRASALALLDSSGGAASSTVLIAVDPGSHELEIVTGSRAAASIDDRSCGLAALAMISSFTSGDLVGGIRNGVQVLVDHAQHAPARHLPTT